MSLLQLLRRAGRRVTPLGLRDRLRASALVRSLFLRNRFTAPAKSPDPKWHAPRS
jgi:hypothetical protein